MCRVCKVAGVSFYDDMCWSLYLYTYIVPFSFNFYCLKAVQISGSIFIPIPTCHFILVY